MTMKRVIYAIAISLIFGLAFSSCHSTKNMVTGDKGEVTTKKPTKKPKKRRSKLADDISGVDDFVPSKRNPVMWVDEGTIDPAIINRVLAEAKTWLGTRYVYGGNTRYGIDCSGFVKNVYQNALGINISRTATLQQRECTLLKREELEPGDLIFFATVKGPGVIAHVGMYVGDGMMIHASSRRGVIYSPVDGGYYLEKWHSAGRLNKVIEKNDELAKQLKSQGKSVRKVVKQPKSTPVETKAEEPKQKKAVEQKTEPKSEPKATKPVEQKSEPKVTKPSEPKPTPKVAEKPAENPTSQPKTTTPSALPVVEKPVENTQPSALDLLIKQKTDSIYHQPTPIK